MKLVRSVFLCIVGIISTGCINNSPLAGTPQSSILSGKPQAVQTTTTQSTKVETDKTKTLKIGDISELKDDKTCDDVGEILVYAETENYKVSVCAEKNNRQDPSFIKITRKDGSLKIAGKAQLGWKEDSFVGMDEKYGYRLRMPSSNKFDLSLLSGTEFAPVWLHEDIQRYYAINHFKQIKNVDELSRRVDSKLPDESKRIKFINYIFEYKERLGACQLMDSRKDTAYFSSRLWKVEDKTYFLELACRTGAYAISLNFFRITESDSGYSFKLMDIPTVARHKGGEIISGENGYVLIGFSSTVTPAREHLFKLEESTLSIYMGKGSCGTLSKYKISNDKLDLIQHKEGSLKECNDFRYATDPILYPNISLEPAK
jgi:hypothetical protein